MTYDHELVLIGQKFESDEIGNQIPVETRTSILCCLKSVGRTEFYNAAVAGLRPTAVFVIHAYEYSDEQQVEFNGLRYRVLRTYATDTEEVELTCERRTGDG
ncbi:phage head closure protein [Brevibacillus agri]|uniref:phage head closure protein n=1 Tax=Brevibacillus TaxID=55080 RepID=UPI000271BB85|nr:MULTISPECIES: phage head closure protein [Brevibacillus]EJL44024.1 phage head-tail adaptor, putative, SPP1 family [Brevibacillus sp. CF112]MBG9567563.1 phage head-tail adaptor [Brevibacillus agri]MBG9567594.1 phage head-tail adaptor [Brevibacillus agri]MED1642300.1 phage head closure protein [Brevibacillus agri]MED1657719.1 phage head closure protein [Brevibacillus agri]